MARYRSPTAFEFVEEQCHDLSSGGMFIQSPLPAPLGTLLKLECEVDAGRDTIRGVARVVWHREQPTDEGPRGMGVKFVKLERGSREIIDQLVTQLGAAPVRAEQEQEAQQRRSLPPTARISLTPPATSQPPSLSAAASVEAPAPPSASTGATSVDADTHARPSAAVSPSNGHASTAADPGREPSQDRPKKARPEAANLRERLERSRRSHEDIDTNEVLAAAAAARGEDETQASTVSASHEPASSGSDAAASASFTPAEAVDAESAEHERRNAVQGHEVSEPIAPSAPTSVWPSPPGGLALKIAVGVLLGYLVVLFGPSFSTNDDAADGPPAPLPVDAPESVAAAAAPMAPAPVASAPPVGAAATPLSTTGGGAEPSAAIAPEVTTAAVEPDLTAVSPDGAPSYVVDVITTPPGARVSAGTQAVVAPGRLNLGALARPVKLLAEKEGYSPTAALVERAGFDLADGVMRRHIFLKLAPIPTSAATVPAPAPGPVVAAAAPAAASAPTPAAPSPAPSAASPAPSATPAPKPPATDKSPAPIDAAMACLAQGDNGCVIKALDGKAKSPQELELLVETFRTMGRTGDAERTMQLYVRRFPDERRAATYRRLLERREAESEPEQPPQAKAGSAPAEAQSTPAEPKAAEPKAEAPKAEAPKAETPKPETPAPAEASP